MRASLWFFGWLLLALLPGCLFTGNETTPPLSEGVIVYDQVVVHSDFDLPRRNPILQDLARVRRLMARQLQLPDSKEPVHIYLFETTEKYASFVQQRYPELPHRRAFFVDNRVQLAVYAQWGKHLEEDLRHEVVHGFLHSVTPVVPIWIDEGLAEYYESPSEAKGFHRQHANLLQEQLQQRMWRPDIRRMEQLKDVGDMIQIDYAEAWAWAHWLINSGAKQRKVLQGYLADLRSGRHQPPLSFRIREAFPDPEQLLLDHLATLASSEP